jgi:hypothetical protein
MTRKQKQIKMKRQILKLHDKKYANLLDDRVKECIQKNENYELEYKGKTMILTAEDLKTKCVSRQYIEKPKYGEKPYHLLSYLWEPTKTTKDE